jgi:hypothetical protein
VLLEPLSEGPPHPEMPDMVLDVEAPQPELFSSKDSRRVMISRNLGRTVGSLSQQFVINDA